MWATLIATAVAAAIAIGVVNLAAQINEIKNAQSLNAAGSAELHQPSVLPGRERRDL